MRNAIQRILCAALLVTPLGCDVGASRRQAALQAELAAEKANVEAIAAVAAEKQTDAVVEALTKAGAKLEQADSGVVTSVDLRGVEATDPLATNLSKLSRLEKLSIDQSALTLEGWKSLAKLGTLQQLDLRDCPLDSEQFIVAVGGMPKLKAVRLSGKNGLTTVDDAGMAVLAKCPELKALAIDDLWVTSEGISHLTTCEKLVEFYAGGTTIDDEAAIVLAKLPTLRKLRLARTSIGTKALETLSILPLEDLDISEASAIDDDSLAAVGKMKSLKRLNLWRDTVSDLGMLHLAGLTNLEWLNLDNTHISDNGLPHLSGLKKVSFLHLGSTGVTDAGMPNLVSMESLKDLKVTRTAVTEAGVEVVKKAIPGIDVQLKYIEGE